jgi:stage II sporulation protein AA (anti-sigma F factor antagonist)
MADLKLSRRKAQDAAPVVVVRLTGEMGGGNGRQADAYFDETLQAEKPRHVLLDLGDLTFADSAFFSSLLFWREEMMKRGGALVLFGLRPEIASTMRLLTLDRILTVRPDEPTALAALPKQ